MTTFKAMLTIGEIDKCPRCGKGPLQAAQTAQGITSACPYDKAEGEACGWRQDEAVAVDEIADHPEE